ncbi:PREDICTED: uncharacterized protein LOC105450597 [Wasmannia auropunctata]|uniref:uncharacterized protein LOC105450597 n=1 Tax=Wasmannia auropunctata TaxID=64793 RepID=UPI0005ED5B77|nr:PREDICTED: uncharacterized protein LOC105450597 [Wasmannia auropunctata]
MPIGSPTLSKEEASCEAHFRETHSRSSTGRYIVRLPFRASTSSLGHSRSQAERALRRMQQRFQGNWDLSRLYSEFLQEYEALGHMRKVPPIKPLAPAFFLPHHGVLRPSSTTSKLRVVFNESARSTSGVSLNECLHVGPKLQQDLADVLLRWRRHSFVFLADVEKMYRQIEVHPADRDFQRILWSPDGEPDEYQLSIVTYGLSCAPFLALCVLLQLTDDEGPRFPDAAPILRRKMYVDYVLSGADTLTLAKAKITQLDGLLKAGGFQLHKWMANDDGHHLRSHRRFQPPAPISVLTKRIVLSRLAQLFDPLGWATLILTPIRAKIFIQDLWRLQIEWDQPMPPLWSQRWMDFEAELGAISSLSLPPMGSWLTHLPSFHGFLDASNDALGAVLYLRSTSNDGAIRVSLIAAKSKVAPIKRVTIPRLELSAAVLLVRLLLRHGSKIILPAGKNFVANRVSAIHELAPEASWHYISGIDNPADCASRGLSPRTFIRHQLWLKGPSALSCDTTSWETSIPPVESSINLEERATVSNLATPSFGPISELVFRYSNLTRLLRITAWLFHACSRFKGTKPSCRPPSLTPQDITQAERFWVRTVQRAHFGRELAVLTRERFLPRPYPFLRLTPFLDADGILRIGGRLRNALIDPDAKHLILMPRDAFFSHLLIEDAHSRTMHGGVCTTGALDSSAEVLDTRRQGARQLIHPLMCSVRSLPSRHCQGAQLPPSRVVPARFSTLAWTTSVRLCSERGAAVLAAVIRGFS